MNSLFFKLSLILADVYIPTPFTLINENPILWAVIFCAFLGFGILTGWMTWYFLKTTYLLKHGEYVSLTRLLWSSIGLSITVSLFLTTFAFLFF